MTAQGNANNRQTPVYARPGSPLTCFGVNRSATRLYFIGANSGLGELAMTVDGWETGDIFTPVPQTPLTCFGIFETDPRVFYIDKDSVIFETFPADDPTEALGLASQSAPDSPLTCLGLNGKGLLYYVDTSRQVHEVAANEDGTLPDLVMPGTKVAAGGDLTCTKNSQGLVKVFYVDATDNLLHVLTYDNVDDPGGITNEPFKDTHPAPGSALTSFTMADTDNTRVYYLDRQNRINELAWNGDTRKNHVLPYTAMPGSALTCFGVGGKLTRVYYLDDNAQVNELAWQVGSWSPHSLPWIAARDSALTCYGANGTATRLYYLDADYQVNELAWDGQRFVNTPLLAGT